MIQMILRNMVMARSWRWVAKAADCDSGGDDADSDGDDGADDAMTMR